jgi:hypothetical protein
MKRRALLLAVLGAVASSALVVGVVGTPAADAIIRRRTITPEVDTGLPIRTEGRHVSMTGPMACDPGENWEVRAELTQASARGGGRSEGVCRGDIQEWVVRVAAEGTTTRFEPGEARGCAVLRTLREGAQTDRHEWCNDIVLISAGEESDDDEDGAGAISWIALAVGAAGVVVAVAALLRPRRAG